MRFCFHLRFTAITVLIIRHIPEATTTTHDNRSAPFSWQYGTPEVNIRFAFPFQVRVKLPLLYLIDSIVKNVGDPYKQLFQQEIVGMFVDAFDKVGHSAFSIFLNRINVYLSLSPCLQSKTDKVREKMFALRETWNDVFLQTKLYALDVKVNQIDQNWPIVAKVVTKNPKIHVNPNFLKKVSHFYVHFLRLVLLTVCPSSSAANGACRSD